MKVSIRTIAVMALVAWMGVFSTLHAEEQRPSIGARVQSPEAPQIACKIAQDCPKPLAMADQVQECLTAVCIRGTCGSGIKTGLNLGYKMEPNLTLCYEEAAVCSVAGTAVASLDPNTRTPREDGSLCSSTATQQNVCQRSVCRSMRCVVENDNGVRCNDPDRTPTLCESSLCKNGQCIAQADSSKEGKKDCQPATTRDCKTTLYECTKTGTCEGTTKVSEGSQCAPDLTLGSPDVLPIAFKRLFETAATPPEYACDTATCQLRFCGDGIVNGSEECDGSARKQGIAQNAVCEQTTCKITKDCQYYIPTCASPQPAPTCNGTLACTVGADLCPVWSCNCPAAPTCRTNQYLSKVAGNPCTEYACINCPVVIRPKCYTKAGNYYAPKCTGFNACGQCASWWCYPRGKEFDNGCFPPGVKITLADGSTKAVEEIKVGDLVLSPKTGSGLKVVNLIEGSEELPIIKIQSGDLQLRVTTQHVVVTSEGLKRARDLLITDKISDAKGNFRAIDSIENLPVEIAQKVINFQLSGEDEDVNNHLLISDGVVTGDLYLQNNFDKKKS